MKRVNIKCPYCGSQAFLRPASLVRQGKPTEPGEEVYVCAHYARAKQLFRKDKPNQREAQVMALSRQALLSTAELIKCVEVGVSDISTDEKLLDALYSDTDTTSDNIGDIMRHLVADQDFTLYGLANAITRYSQDVPSYDRATKLEGIGYNVLNMPRDLFRRINQAAGMAA